MPGAGCQWFVWHQWRTIRSITPSPQLRGRGVWDGAGPGTVGDQHPTPPPPGIQLGRWAGPAVAEMPQLKQGSRSADQKTSPPSVLTLPPSDARDLLRPWCRKHSFDPFSAGTLFRRQNLTSEDVRFWRLKTVPALKQSNIYNGRTPIT